MADGRWTEDLFDRMRRVGDPLADSAIKAVFEKGEVAAVNDLLTRLVRNDDVPAGPWPPQMGEYLSLSAQLPDWADGELIRAGEGVFLRYGLSSFGILACASLPECYVLRDVAAVLGATQLLAEHARRRVFETAMMVLAVMVEGGLAPGGSGIRVVQKVRLMHAAVRHLILTPPPAIPDRTPASFADTLLAQRWPAERGTPLSQEDLAAVLLTFSHVMLRGWKHLGIDLSREEAAAYLHCWNVVGHVLGIRDELLARDVEDAASLFEAIKRRRAADTPDGRALTTSLIGVCESFAGPSQILLRPIPRILNAEAPAAGDLRDAGRAEARARASRVSATPAGDGAHRQRREERRLPRAARHRGSERAVLTPSPRGHRGATARGRAHGIPHP